MIRNMILDTTGLLVFLAAGFVLGVVTMDTDKKTTPEKSQVKTISGAPLSAVDYTDRSGVHIDTTYQGAGSSEITVPLSRIPQAAAWEEKRRGVSLLASPRGALYALGSYRIDSVYLSGGFRLPVSTPLSFRDYDVLAGAGVWW